MKKAILLLSMVVSSLTVTNAQVSSSFTTDLQNDTVCSPVTITCVSTSTGTALNYQWIIDGFASFVFTNDTLIYNVGVAGTHTIELEVSNGSGTDVSTFTFVTMEAPQPVITQNGADLTLTGLTGTNTYQWYLNGNIIGGATSDTYTPVQNGNYTCDVTNETGCSGMSAPFNFTTTGVSELSANKTYAMSVYNGTIYVKFNKPTQLEVYDLLGAQIYSYTSTNHEVSLNGGVYIVRSKEFTQKVGL